MPTREEIREGVAIILESAGASKEWTLNILEYLHSQGFVRRVDRELPEQVAREIDEACERYALRPNYANELIAKILDKAGYVAVEPLIYLKGVVNEK